MCLAILVSFFRRFFLFITKSLSNRLECMAYRIYVFHSQPLEGSRLWSPDHFIYLLFLKNIDHYSAGRNEYVLRRDELDRKCVR